MKKTISLILLTSILFISNGYYLYFKYLQHSIHQEIKHEIIKGLNEEDLSLIIVPLTEVRNIEWTKLNKEFVYNGLMYDVVKTKIKNNKKYYYCINDNKEEKLIAYYLSHNKRRNKLLLLLKKLYSHKYFPNSFSINIKTSIANIYHDRCQNTYRSIYIETIPPPPQV
jgi:hypothetical protein